MLPVLEIERAIVESLSQSNRLVLTAPTGSGKSTQVPQILDRLRGVEGRIIVLQPRRLATRMVSRRVADEMRCPIGSRVGYATRSERAAGNDTRILFVTEGLFLRMIQSDPALRGIGAVILDEFHERSVSADVALGLIRRLQETGRGDLKLVVMSATLDAQRVSAHLDCPSLACEGRMFPVETQYLPRRGSEPPWELAALQLSAALDAQPTGHVLVFMPGAYEIGRTIESCRRVAPELAFHPLHGSLSAAQQDAAVAPCERRKVIVATNVAETSLTIEGVTCVIDAGLARVHRYDAARGINSLRVEPISRASADQRAGRAGRTAPGLCIRLWTEPDHHQVHPDRDTPEIQRIELSEPLLLLHSLGHEGRSFPWLDTPPDDALAQAESLLKTLGAVDGAGRLTVLGERMAAFPTHPRLARMLIEASRLGCGERAAMWAAIVSERDILLPSAQPSRFMELGEPASDLAIRERAIRAAADVGFDPRRCESLGVHANTARQVDQDARRLARELQVRQSREASASAPLGTSDDLIRSLLTGFPDHVALKLDAQRTHCAMPGRKRVVLEKTSVVRKPGLVLAVEMREVGRGDRAETVLSLACEVEESWLDPSRLTTRSLTRWNNESHAAESVEERCYGELVIGSRVRPCVDVREGAGMIVERLVNGELKLARWDERVEQWIERVRCAAEWFPERDGLIRYEPDEVSVLLHEIVGEATRFSAVRDAECLEAVCGALGWDARRFVERVAPEGVALPCGKRMRLTYKAGSVPRGRAKIQELFGLASTPRVGEGRVPVLLEVLAPNQRPIQVTDDLANFWKALYPKVRSELRRRYPRHDWREDPWVRIES